MQGSTRGSTLTLGSTVKCEDAHEKHTVECTMESYARGIARSFKGRTPVSFVRQRLKIACVDASKVEKVRACVHALEDMCVFAERKNTIRSK